MGVLLFIKESLEHAAYFKLKQLISTVFGHFMRQENMIGTVFGATLYLRNFFPEESFEQVSERGIGLRILKSTLETKRLVRWIGELEKHQSSIHGVALCIYSVDGLRSCEEGDDARLVEMYTLDVTREPDFKAICRTIQKMDPLSGRFSLKLKVRTHSSIKLRGFKREDTAWMIEDGDRIEVSSMRIFRKRAREASEPSDRCSIGNIKCGTAIINCTCTINTNERDMLQCNECMEWVHAVCCGYFSSEDPRVPRKFKCLKCTGAVTKELRDLCVYRRVLYVVFNEDFSRTNLEERLKITRALAQKALFKLRADGLIRCAKGARKYRIVKDKRAKDKVKEYFNEAEAKCFISVGRVECTLL